MITIFMKSPLPNALAVIVLVALVVTWLASIVLSLRDTPIQTQEGWYAKLPPLLGFLGLPAALDLLQTNGMAFLFAVIVFVVTVLNLVIPILRIYERSSHILVMEWPKWVVPISVVGGLAVTIYLSFVESTGTQIACGPSSGCGAVQSTRYSVLFGVLPLGILGLAGYLGILAGWAVWQIGPEAIKKIAALIMWGMCVFGVLFSIYLTFLEPFVIGETCMWCISSAVLMAILLVSTTPAAQQAFVISDE